MEENEAPESFDKDYVQKLRNEAAKYRTEAKELKSELKQYEALEAQINSVRIENEFAKKGITADPSWIQIQDGQTPQDAVENFLVKYPQFAEEHTPVVDQREMPKAIPPSREKASGKGLSGVLGNRSLSEIQKDPIARGNLRDLYRDLLRTTSNLPND
jgi:hypothetical protein